MMQLDSSMIPPQHPQPSVEDIPIMESKLYKAAEDGNIEPFDSYLGDLRWLVDGRKNTALHIFSRTGGLGGDVVNTHTRFLCFQEGITDRDRSTDFVEHLLDKCPSLLLQPNDKEEIPLHIAARHGHDKIVNVLIDRARAMPLPPHEDLEKGRTSSEATGCYWVREMLRKKDGLGNTAFHKAVERDDVDVVRSLMKEIKELDPDLSSSANGRDETPIYMAAKTSWDIELVDQILDHCKPVDYGGPDGTTALHAVLMRGWDEMQPVGKSIIDRLIKARKQLTRKADNKGRTPLHYAAHIGYKEAVNMLLETDPTAACIPDKVRGMTALHMAAWVGKVEIMEEIISHCPSCCEIVDNKGWNFLHFAAIASQPRELEGLLYGDDKGSKIKYSLIEKLLFEKDLDGIMPWDIFSTIVYSRSRGFSSVLNLLQNQRFDKLMSDSDPSYAKNKKLIREKMKEIGDKAEVAGIPPHKFFRENMEDEKMTLETIDKLRETHLLVAALVATVTFAAAIAVPGGYKSGEGTAILSPNSAPNMAHDGTAILSPNSAFKAFVITNAMAFVCSLLAIFLHFLSSYIPLKASESLVHKWIIVADGLTILAMAAMVVSFSAGSYAVLESSKGIAIATCSIGLTFFPFSLIIPSLIYYFFKRNR